MDYIGLLALFGGVLYVLEKAYMAACEVLGVKPPFYPPGTQVVVK